MSPTKTQKVEWRFGDREESVQAWLRHSAELHMVVVIRSPEGGQWHSIMTVTRGWLRKHAEEPFVTAIWPALLIVPDGPRSVIEKSITEELDLGWRLIIQNAEPLPGEPILPGPEDL
jgi:hypothetical protein